MNLPTVTVVVPAFNAEQWIAESLLSVVAQTYSKDCLEVIVVDDGSSDATPVEASRILATSGIAWSMLRNQSAQGTSAARNAGWQRARGTWIQFLDADDLLDPRKIELQARAAGDCATDIAAVFSRWGRLAWKDGAWVPESWETEPSIGADPAFDLLRADNFMATGSQLFRRTFLERVSGYTESYNFIEDVDLLLRISFEGGLLRLVPSATPLFWYRQRTSSLSRSNERAFNDGCVRNATLAERHWRQRDELTASRTRLLTETYSRGARYYAEHDPDMLMALTQKIYGLEPQFVPARPASLRVLTRILGYARAERCAVQYRRLKRSVLGTAL